MKEKSAIVKESRKQFNLEVCTDDESRMMDLMTSMVEKINKTEFVIDVISGCANGSATGFF